LFEDLRPEKSSRGKDPPLNTNPQREGRGVTGKDKGEKEHMGVRGLGRKRGGGKL